MKLVVDRMPGTGIDPEKWDKFVQNSPQGALYALHGYATAIKPDWEAVIVRKGEEWQAVMPLALSRKWGFTALLQPTFAQYWGILFKQAQFASAYLHSQWEKRVVTELIPYCDAAHLYIMNFSPEFSCGLPFHWAGFKTSIRYTQVLDLRPSTEELSASFASSLRRQIRKAERNAVQLDTAVSIAELLDLIRLSEQSGKSILSGDSRAYAQLRRVATYLQECEAGLRLGARDKDGKLLAAGLWATFGEKGLYLIGAYHPDYPNSGAMSWLMWEAIRHMHILGQTVYDFEGSMIPGIEHFFAKFNASHKHYFQIHKNQLPLPLRWIHALR